MISTSWIFSLWNIIEYFNFCLGFFSGKRREYPSLGTFHLFLVGRESSLVNSTKFCFPMHLIKKKDLYTGLWRQRHMLARLDVMRHVYCKIKTSQNLTNTDFHKGYSKRLTNTISRSSTERQQGIGIVLVLNSRFLQALCCNSSTLTATMSITARKSTTITHKPSYSTHASFTRAANCKAI